MNNENSALTEAQIKKQRNIENNANNIRNAAEMASKSGNAYAKAIGTAVKTADKFSGGKSSERLGKTLNNINKTSLSGRVAQAALNKMSESGTSDRINNAMNKKKGAPATANNNSATANSNSTKNNNSAPTDKKNKGTLSSKNLDSSSTLRETRDEASDGGSASFNASFKIVKIGLIVCAAVFPIIIFCNLFLSASQIYIKSIGLGNADSLSDKDVEKKINKKQENTEDLDESIDENDLAIDYFISDRSITLRDNKLKQSNVVQIADTKYLRRKYNEASLDALEDFYPNITNASKNYDENLVYDFFFKMYNLFIFYRDTYDVYLDLPLLMSTLTLQSDDMNEVFSSNLSKADRSIIARKQPVKEYDYNYDWSTSNYGLSMTNSEHDMEILAQRMVSYQVKETCVDSSGDVTKENILRDNETKIQVLTCSEGETYKTEELGMQKDDEKYKEFLKEFIEKKYYLPAGSKVSPNPINGIDISKGNNSTGSNSFAQEMINLARNEYIENNGATGGLKYINAYGGFGPGTPWCAIFVWYISANTKYNGKSLYPDIINLKDAGAGPYLRYFNDQDHLKFYYNDSCSNLKGKNGPGTYKPKMGDFIFFNWDAEFDDIETSMKDHVGIVESYEDGYVNTIEGNYSDTIGLGKYSMSDCRVVGFGSWY